MSYDADKKKYIIVEGNIGAGKSTFLRIIKKQLNIPIIFEPVDKWQAVGGTTDNLLEKFYADTMRWAYTFQSYAFITRIFTLEHALKKSPGSLYILERSVFSDRYCFAKNCYEQGLMSAMEWQLYTEWFSWLTQHVMTNPLGFIYLQADPSICYQRLCKRGRSEESPVSLSYLQQLHTKHEQWLLYKEGVADGIQQTPVLTLDCNEEFEDNEAVQQEQMKKVCEFLHTFDDSIVTIKQLNQVYS